MALLTASVRLTRLSGLALAAVLTMAAAALAPRPAQAEALLVIEADSGKVLQAENATYPWYPASITKVMTAYVTLKAVKDGRISLDTLFTVSPTAAAQAPSKMGFPPGTKVTVDNALKMMMVKSANDIAVVLAEGVGGSVDGFADMMNSTAQRLGMTQSHFVNPNGLPAEGHVSSARDLAILARAIFRDMPEYESYMHVPAIKFGRRITANFNKLIGRYPGADGMKTGFICASGFNLVASATRNNRRLIAVVLGAQSSAQRAQKAAQLLERNFGGNRLSWLKPSLGTVESLTPINAAPPNLKEEMCGPKRKRPAAEDEDDDVEVNAMATDTPVSMYSGVQLPGVKVSDLLAAPPTPAAPVIVYTGPARTGAAILEADAAESAAQAAHAAKRKKTGKAKTKAVAADETKSKTAAKTAAKGATKDAAKPATAAKPVAAKPAAAASAKPAAVAAKPAVAKPAVTKPAVAKPAAVPAKPAAVAKPAAAKSAAARPVAAGKDAAKSGKAAAAQ